MSIYAENRGTVNGRGRTAAVDATTRRASLLGRLNRLPGWPLRPFDFVVLGRRADRRPQRDCRAAGRNARGDNNRTRLPFAGNSRGRAVGRLTRSSGRIDR